jgi:hypothetical protein
VRVPDDDRQVRVSCLRERFPCDAESPRLSRRDRANKLRLAVLEQNSRISDDRLPFARPIEVDVDSSEIILNGFSEDPLLDPDDSAREEVAVARPHVLQVDWAQAFRE